jgi:hypothetical protein
MEVTTEKKFLDENEFKTLQEIKEQTQFIISELGQIELLKIQLEQRQTSIRNFLEEVSDKENKFTEVIFEKYGKSNIDPNTGEIVKLD